MKDMDVVLLRLDLESFREGKEFVDSFRKEGKDVVREGEGMGA